MYDKPRQPGHDPLAFAKLAVSFFEQHPKVGDVVCMDAGDDIAVVHG